MANASFEELFRAHGWEPILNCPGRYALRGVDRYLSIEAIAGPAIQVTQHQSNAAKDTVLVVSLEGGGVISYKRADGSYLHTLNDEEGFERKLKQLGIRVEVD